MKFQLLCLVVTTYTALANSRNMTYIITSTSEASYCPDHADRCLTLNELITNQGQSAFQSQEIVVFQTGVHIVNGTERKNLSVVDIKNVTIKGDSKASDVIITCFTCFHFLFKKVNTISIVNLTFNNCISSEEARNHTLFFTDVTSTLLLDSIQIILSERGERKITRTSITIFANGALVQLINSKMFERSGMYIGLSSTASNSTVQISNSVFNDSCIRFETFLGSTNSTKAILVGSIKNSTFARCKCWYVINIKGLKEQRINLTIVDVNIVNSTSPFLMYAKRNIFICFKGNINFSWNKGIAYAMKSEVLFVGAQVRFCNNTLMNTLGVPMYAVNATITFEDSNVQFKNNTGLFCGGIGGKDMQIIVKDNSTIDFINNKGQNGGALALSGQSVVKFEVKKENMAGIRFERNEAQRGGGIFITDLDYFSLLYLNLRVSAFNFKQNFGNVTLTFVNNSAQMGGNQVYGGWIDWSVGNDGIARCNPNRTSKYLHFENAITDKDIASDPLRVCLCFDQVPNCSIDEHQLMVYGRAFSLDLVAVGQRFGTVTTFVEASLINLNSSMANIYREHRVQMVQRNCTTLQYSILSDDDNRKLESLTLVIKPSLSLRESRLKFDDQELQNHPNYFHLFQTFSINLNITDCPIGFKLNYDDGTCICQPELLGLHLSCNLTNYKICRNGHQWIGVTHEHRKTDKNKDPGIIAHQHCPFDYCNQSLPLIGLDHPNAQCAFNRVGILCGKCKSGFSVMLGSSKCRKCSNFTLLAIIPIYI